MNLQEKIEDLRKRTLSDLLSVADEKTLNNLRTVMLGKKGELTEILKGMKDLTNEERPVIGALANAFRDEFGAKFEAKKVEIEQAVMNAALESETLDVTLPGKAQKKGSRHILTQTQEEIEEIFLGMGYEIVDGYEVETDHYNFERMNLPKDHPARDMQDSFYITDSVLLRTHTSPVQARTMQRHEPNSPIRMIAPGKVYRWDYDATHSPVFHQVEGLIIDEHITFADLKGTLESFLRHMYGDETKVRFRTSFFPFTEPSAEVDISCVMCGGDGCRVCSHTGWLEILGCGMVHPDVLRINGYDPEKVKGFAFGMGVERIAMLLYGINDLRLFFEDDVRFLEQF